MQDAVKNKLLIHTGMSKLLEAPVNQITSSLAELYHDNASWRGSHPINELSGVEAIANQVWSPLREAMPDLERRDEILLGGTFENQYYVGALGHLLGRFTRPWLDIAPTGGAMSLRYGEYHQIQDGKIIQSTVLFDLLDFIYQTGHWPLAPALGSMMAWPGPLGCDGILLEEQDSNQSAASLKLVLDMHKSLQDYDDSFNTGREGLLTMPQVKYWHPKMMWYGPAGIGAGRGLEGFIDVHQLSFRTAFPNRNAIGHYVRIGDGKYAATGGWPSVEGTHLGANWLGLAPSGNKVLMRVMDFYACDGDLIRENWIPWDIPHTLLQLGLDVFARMREQRLNR